MSKICGICDQSVRLLYEDEYPCRVCGKAFHYACLEKSGKDDMQLVVRANSSVGWSCVECDDLSSLLTPDEFEDLTSKFEDMDKLRDSKISVDEFLVYCNNKSLDVMGTTMTDDDKRVARQQFSLLDVDGSGELDYTEFLKHEAAGILAQRDPHDLVALLSPLEEQSARQMFHLIDKDEDGTLDESEIRGFYRGWYTNLDFFLHSQENIDAMKCDQPAPSIGDTDATQLHVETNTDLLMAADTNNSGDVDWDEFLRHQAIYIISSRPNKVNLDLPPHE